jgi:GNAT superfamily N-acetyltransferase
VSRRLHDLTVTNLDDLPGPCRGCTFWEGGWAWPGVQPGDDKVVAGRDSAAAAKEAWWQATQLEWGTPGKAAYADGRLVGYALFAPARHFPRAGRLGPSVSDDALLLATLWVAAPQRRNGIGKALVQAVLRETVRRGGRALEAYGRRWPERRWPEWACVAPESFLAAVGFTVLREHVEYPLLRLDVRQTARWQESWGQAVEGVVAALTRRERAPAPGRTAPARQ